MNIPHLDFHIWTNLHEHILQLCHWLVVILAFTVDSATINCALKSFKGIEVSLAKITALTISNSSGSPDKVEITKSLFVTFSYANTS